MAGAQAPTRFIVFATQRTGSSWVSSMLGSHPAVETFGELFQRGAKREKAFAAYAAARGGGRGLVTSYLDEVYRPRHGIEAVGFKVMYEDVNEHPALLTYLARRRVKIVHLVRANLLDIVVSVDAAYARGRFHAAGEVDHVAVHIDPATVVRRLRVLDRRVRLARLLLAGIAAPRIEVAYEDLCADPGRFEDVLRFLGVRDAAAPLTTRLKKLNSLPRERTIGNFADVERVLTRTRYRAFLT